VFNEEDDEPSTDEDAPTQSSASSADEAAAAADNDVADLSAAAPRRRSSLVVTGSPIEARLDAALRRFAPADDVWGAIAARARPAMATAAIRRCSVVHSCDAVSAEQRLELRAGDELRFGAVDDAWGIGAATPVAVGWFPMGFVDPEPAAASAVVAVVKEEVKKVVVAAVVLVVEEVSWKWW
jgi:hypothetical protein